MRYYQPKLTDLPAYIVAELEVAFENLFLAKLDVAEGRALSNHAVAKNEERLGDIARRIERDIMDEPQIAPDYDSDFARAPR